MYYYCRDDIFRLLKIQDTVAIPVAISDEVENLCANQ